MKISENPRGDDLVVVQSFFRFPRDARCSRRIAVVVYKGCMYEVSTVYAVAHLCSSSL